MPVSIATFLTSPDAHPIALVLLLTSKYGVGWAAWEPEVLWSMLAKDFVEPSQHTRAKLQAARTILVSNAPFSRWEVFAWVSQAVNNNLPDFQQVHPASLPQLFHTVWTMQELRDKPEFDDEIQRWVAACALNEGIVFLPPPLDFAQKQTSMVEYRCKRCGNMDPDENTPECDWCGAPPSELEKQPRYIDPASIASMWEMVKGKPSDSVVLQEDMVGVHLARLLVARDYLDMRKQQAENQVKELGLWR